MGLGEPRPGKFVRVSEAREQFFEDVLSESKSEKNMQQ